MIQIRIDLAQTEIPTLLIIRDADGAEISNQVGGNACLHLTTCGQMLPLQSIETEGDPLEGYYESLPPSPENLANRILLVDRWLKFHHLDGIFEPDTGDFELAEAWVPVRICKELHDSWLPLLGSFLGTSAVITYENSD